MSSKSEPPISLSTFLLHHLPFSSEKSLLNSSDSSSSVISLPLSDGDTRVCKLHTVLVRDSWNTITAVLRPEWILWNQTDLTLFLIEPATSMDNTKELEIECLPSSHNVLSNDEVS